MASKLREVYRDLYQVSLPLPMPPSIVHVYLVHSEGEWALVDTGMRSQESVEAFRAALETLGIEPEAVTKIICTHQHPDHFGTSGPYRSLCKAEVFLHPREADLLAMYARPVRPAEAVAYLRRHGIPGEPFGHIPTPGEFWAGLFAPATPDQLMNDGDVIPVGARRLHVVWTPGHAPGHCCLWLPEDKVLLVGDHLLPKITPHVGLYPGGPEDPLNDYLNSLAKVAALDVTLVLPAHGGVFSDHRKRVQQITHHHHYRMEEIHDVLRARPQSAYETAMETFGLNPESSLLQQFPATFETLAHLESLRRKGRVLTEERDGVLLWKTKRPD